MGEAFESLTVAVPGGEIFATRRGMGEGPPVLLLHGGPGIGAENLVSLVEELDGIVDGVLPQQRGLEPSTLEGPRDVETHVADAIAVLDHLGWERAWLIGHSWGGHLGMHIAVAHPDRVAGLIALETLGAIPDGGSDALMVNMVARLTPDERADLDKLIEAQVAGEDDPDIMFKIYVTLWPSYSAVHGEVLPFSSLRLEAADRGRAGHHDLRASPFQTEDAGARPAQAGPSRAVHPRRRRPDAAAPPRPTRRRSSRALASRSSRRPVTSRGSNGPGRSEIWSRPSSWSTTRAEPLSRPVPAFHVTAGRRVRRMVVRRLRPSGRARRDVGDCRGSVPSPAPDHRRRVGGPRDLRYTGFRVREWDPNPGRPSHVIGDRDRHLGAGHQRGMEPYLRAPTRAGPSLLGRQRIRHLDASSGDVHSHRRRSPPYVRDQDRRDARVLGRQRRRSSHATEPAPSSR